MLVLSADRRGHGQGARSSEEEAAATAIQAGYRGYRTRREMKEREAAATKIQAGFRGHQTRQQLNPTAAEPSSRHPSSSRPSCPPLASLSLFRLLHTSFICSYAAIVRVLSNLAVLSNAIRRSHYFRQPIDN